MNKPVAFDYEESSSKWLPSGWAEARLIDLVAREPNAMTDGPFGSKLKSSHYVPDGVRVIRLGNLGIGEFKNDDKSFVSPEHAATLARHRVNEGDLLIAALAEPVGRCCRVPASVLPALVKADCVRYKPHADIDSKFLMHWLNSPQGSKIAEGQSHGVGRLRINMKNMRELPVLVAPLPEQHRIVAEIEKQFTRLDAAVANLERVRANLKRARASVLKAAVEGRLVPTEAALARASGGDYEPASVLLERILDERKRKHTETNGKKKYKPPVEPETEGLPELPEGWAWASVDQLSTLVRNGYSKKPDDDGETPILRISAVRACFVDRKDSRRLRAPPSEFAAATVYPGDLLFTRYNGTRSLVGVCGVLRGDAPIVYPDKLIRVVIASSVEPAFLEKVANVGASRAFIESKIRTTAGQAGISGTDIKNLPVPLAPALEQRRAVEEIERRLSVLDALNEVVTRSLARCNRLRQSILKRAFEGKLVPQDPNDEPASELLARIHAEAAAAAKKAPTKTRAPRKK